MRFSFTLALALFALAFTCLSMAPAADTPAKDQAKDGIIKSVDLTAKTFVLERAPRPMTFTVNDKTVVTLDGTESTFEAAVKPTCKASVTYAKVGDNRLASKIDVTTVAKTPDKVPAGDQK